MNSEFLWWSTTIAYLVRCTTLYTLAADERRSCAIDVSTTPIHIMGARTCGTKSHPWIVEAPVGQKINVSLLNFSASAYDKKEWNSKHPCSDYGVIVDKTSKRNITICVAKTHKEKVIYLSKGNALDIYLDTSDIADVRKFILKLHGQYQCLGSKHNILVSFSNWQKPIWLQIHV